MVDEIELLFKSLSNAKDILSKLNFYELQLIIILVKEELEKRERKEG